MSEYVSTEWMNTDQMIYSYSSEYLEWVNAYSNTQMDDNSKEWMCIQIHEWVDDWMNEWISEYRIDS